MKNSIQNIGEIIKSERLRANLTQSELAGDRITRNMLSMIEAGEAKPSLETLEYIANRLDVPAGLFFASNERDAALYNKTDAISKAKRFYTEKRYAECAEVCKSVPFDDELYSLLAECMLKSAESYMKKNMLTSASSEIEHARNFAKRSIYLSDDFTGTLDAYEAFISFAADRIDADALSAAAKKRTRIPASVFIYISALLRSDEGGDPLSDLPKYTDYLIPDQIKYLRAKQLMREYKFAKAVEILEPLTGSENLGFISKYRIAADLESCFENRRDFEMAYKYSTVKHHLLETFSK